MMSNNNSNLLLLDTHVWIWLINGDQQLKSSKAITHIEKAAQHSNIRISAISVWETGMLEAKGRISLKYDCIEWVNHALAGPGISLLPLTPEIAIKSSRLPGIFHGDPADRIIVASAMGINASLVTKDRKILKYCKSKNINFINV